MIDREKIAAKAIAKAERNEARKTQWLSEIRLILAEIATIIKSHPKKTTFVEGRYFIEFRGNDDSSFIGYLVGIRFCWTGWQAKLLQSEIKKVNWEIDGFIPDPKGGSVMLSFYESSETRSPHLPYFLFSPL